MDEPHHHFFNQDIWFIGGEYYKHLSQVSEAQLTPREIEIMACLAAGRSAKKISSFLGIAAKTAENHLRNIMIKLDCHNRENIVDYVEKPNHYQYYKDVYTQITLSHSLKTILTKTLKKSETKINLLLCHDIMIAKQSFLHAFKKILTTTSIKINAELCANASQKITLNELNSIDYVLWFCLESKFNSSDLSFLPSNIPVVIISRTNISYKINREISCIAIEHTDNYFHFALTILKKIIPNLAKEQDFIKLETYYTTLLSSKQNKQVESTQNHQCSIKKTLATYSLLLSTLFIIIGAGWWFNNNETLTPYKAKSPQDIGSLSSWRLPPKPSYYVDRKILTETILKNWKKDMWSLSTVAMIGLHGLGGVGKSTMAAELINHPPQKYNFRAWLQADNKAVLIKSYLELGQALNLFKPTLPLKQKISSTRSWLEQQGSVMLVYDNVPDINILDEFLPNNGHIIITSRNYQLPNAVAIEGMTEQEAINLFNELIPSYLKKNSDYNKHIKQLAKELDYFPLAIAQAGNYITSNQLTVRQYFKIYQNKQNALLLKNSLSSQMPHDPVYVTWNLNLEAMSQYKSNKIAMQILDVIAYSYPDGISKTYLAQYLSGHTNEKAQIRLNEAINLLRRYSLVKISNDKVSVHRLVQAWLRNKHSTEEKKKFVRKAIQTILKLYQNNADTIWTTEFNDQDLELYKNLLLQAEALLPYCQSCMPAKVLARTHLKMAEIYLHITHDYNKSFELLSKVLPVYEANLAMYDKERTWLYHQLGWVSYRLRNYKVSKLYLEKALIGYQHRYGKDSIKTTWALNHLARIQLGKGNYVNSKKLIQQSIDILNHQIDSYPMRIAWSYRQLGRIHLELGEHSMSETMFKKVLAIYEKKYQTQHADIAWIYRNLGRLYYHTNRLSKSREFLEKALAIDEKIYGYNHPNTAWSCLYLGRLYTSLGLLMKAKQLLEKASKIHIHHYGKNNSVTGWSYYALGHLHTKLGNYDKASTFFNTCTTIHEEHFGKQHIRTAKCYRAQGCLNIAQSKFEQSRVWLDKAMTIYNKHYGDLKQPKAKLLKDVATLREKELALQSSTDRSASEAKHNPVR